MNASARTREPGKEAWPHYTTPAPFLERLYRMGPVALDPCSNPASIVVARKTYCGPDVDGKDGLALPWVRGGGLNFVNPPYGRELFPWTAKMASEAQVGAEVVGLLPAATGPKWFHRNVATATALLFVEGRYQFGNPPPPKCANCKHRHEGELCTKLVRDPGKRLHRQCGCTDWEPFDSEASTFDNLVPYWGRRPSLFREAFEGCGLIVEPVR